MTKDSFFIHVSKKENGKQTRHFLKEVSGVVNDDLKVGFAFDEYKQFTATDILTGRAIVSGYGMDLQYHIDAFMNNCIDALNRFRNAYYYNDAVKVFNTLKEQSEPITERKLRGLISK